MDGEEPPGVPAPTGEGREPVADPDFPELAELELDSVTARESLSRARRRALQKQEWETGWLMLFGVGPAALIAIVLALLLGRPDLVIGFSALGLGVQMWRVWRGRQTVKEIERELEDPIDGS